MIFDLILSNVAKHISLNEKEQDIFCELLSNRTLSKKSFALKAGDECKYIYFLNSGLLRSFYLSPEGKDSTVMFAIEDWWITDMYCFINGQPAMVSIEAVEESQVLGLSKSGMDTLLEKVPKFEKFFRILLQNAYSREQLRVIQNLSLSSKERYENFAVKYPQIASKLTQKQIASYLGITPEFLSYLRSRKEG